MRSRLIIGAGMVFGMILTASAQYTGWQHSGSLYIITTPEGANLPATASEANFPLLVRLNKEWFDFSQAKADGSDLRFSIGGKPLAFQIEEWDAAEGTASVWVRVPSITGNARQEMKIYWGKADAAGESSGKAVFNESNGYLTVMHLGDPVNAVKDEVGTLSPTNFGATVSTGMIGKSLNFVYGRPGVVCGEDITDFPQGNSESSTELWFKDNKLPGPWGSRFVCWGREDSGSKLLIGVLSPLHIQAGLDCEGPVSLEKWYHVVHTYETNGMQKVYVNGRLSASVSRAINFKTPTRMYIGNWYRNWESDCDVDEVRISKVTRSADWVKMEYENQNSMQTLGGILPQSGSAFSVSAKKITVMEGKRATVTAKAGGAQKVYWILKKDGLETIVAVDTFSFTVEADRITGDQRLALQFKAVFADQVKTLEIPVTLKEDIPDPVFSLKVPAKWDGRKTIAVVAQISNLNTMQTKGVTNLTYDWTVPPIVEDKGVEPGKLILKRARNSGELIVTAAVSNSGAASPTGDWDYKSYQQYFLDMSAAWKQDYPNIRNYYVYQVWPLPCSMGPKGAQIREAQRTLPRLYSNLSVMSTIGITNRFNGRGLCHFDWDGYEQFATLMGPLVERDNYGMDRSSVRTAPELKKAYYTTSQRDEVALAFGQPMAWASAAAKNFYLDGVKGQVVSGSASGNVIKLLLAGPSKATSIDYLADNDWDGESKNLLWGSNGIAALTFCEVPLEPLSANP